MAAFSARFEGLTELEAKLLDLSGPAANRATAKALRAGGKVIQAAIQERAPIRPPLPSGNALPPGALALDIELQLGKSSATGLPVAIVSPGDFTAYVAEWVEYGHRLVKGGRNSMKRGKLQGNGHQIGDVPAYPFIRPGYEASRGEAVEVLQKVYAEEIEKEAKR